MGYLIGEIMLFLLAAALVGGFIGFLVGVSRSPRQAAAGKIADMERLLEACDHDMAHLHAEIAGLRARLVEHESQPEVGRAG